MLNIINKKSLISFKVLINNTINFFKKIRKKINPYLTFWKMSDRILHLQQTLKFANEALDLAENSIIVRNGTIEYILIEQFADILFQYKKLLNPQPTKDDEALFKDCVREVFDICQTDYSKDDLYRHAYISIGDVQLPKEYLTEKELSIREDMDYEKRYLNGDHIANCSYSEFIEYEMSDLKKRGYYDYE